MRIAICDDESAQCQLLESHLKEYADKENILVESISFSSAEKFLFTWEEDKNFDLLILDIEMGCLSGMDLAFKLRKEGSSIPILFITGYEDYMSQGYEVEALHYLLKPIHKEKLFEVLARLQKNNKKEQKILLQTEDGVISIFAHEIWYIEACGHYCNLVATEKSYELRHSISELKNMLKQENAIVQSHRSYLVNLQYVSSLLQGDIIMDNGMKIPVSRGSAKEVNKAFIRYYTN